MKRVINYLRKVKLSHAPKGREKAMHVVSKHRNPSTGYLMKCDCIFLLS